MSFYADYVIVGGGIAAVSCVEQLLAELPICEEEAGTSAQCQIALISASSIVKAATNYRQIGRAAETFDIEQRDAQQKFAGVTGRVRVLHARVTDLLHEEKCVLLENGEKFGYKNLCIATGALPKRVHDSSYVHCLRDTHTVNTLQHKLGAARRILLVGNGGIATELAYELQNVEVIWAVKQTTVSSTFFDAEQTCGSALGPDWANDLNITDLLQKRQVHVITDCHMNGLYTAQQYKATSLQCSVLPNTFSDQVDWPVFVVLSNGQCHGCDLVLSATGVQPNVQPWTSCQQLQISSDGGISVDEYMETSVPHVYAVGDVCTAAWQLPPHWMQMRLWTQARQMGAYCGRVMAQRTNGVTDLMQDICFEIFTHCTQFFGYKVILLGKYNAQGLGTGHEALLRVTPGVEFIKVLIEHGRVQGALLIGDTGLEETLENLILNGTDIELIKDGLLEPGIDIEDYFD